jgi:hypothetical protein
MKRGEYWEIEIHWRVTRVGINKKVRGDTSN